MPHLFCAICRDGIPIQPDNPVTEESEAETSGSEDEGQADTEEDFMIATDCGHIFHNNCLQTWFRAEQNNIRNQIRQIFILRENDDGDVISSRRVYSQTCPYCMETIYAGHCTRLYPMKAPEEPEIPPLIAELKRVVQEYGELIAEFNEVREEYKETVKRLGVETEKSNSRSKELIEIHRNAVQEHSEMEDKWVEAMRILDTKHQETKRFYTGILDAMGFCIPPMHAPDLSVANLIGQVIENREIAPDEGDTAVDAPPPPPMPVTENIPATPSFVQTTFPQPEVGYADADEPVENAQELNGTVKIAVKIGDKVVWPQEVANPMIGIVKWIGKMQHVWTAGVEFEKPIGKHNELIKALRSLFTCIPGHGRLIAIVDLVRYEDFVSNLPRPVTGIDPNEASRDQPFSPISVQCQSADSILNTFRGAPPGGTINTASDTNTKAKHFKRFSKFLLRILPIIRTD